jgi:hypothetical protein
VYQVFGFLNSTDYWAVQRPLVFGLLELCPCVVYFFSLAVVATVFVRCSLFVCPDNSLSLDLCSK